MPKVKVHCAACGAPIYRYPSEIRKNKSGLFFCDINCRSIGWAGGSNPNFGNEWDESQKKELSERLKEQYRDGRTVWNQGLTKETHSSIMAYAIQLIGNDHGKANKGTVRPDVSAKNRDPQAQINGVEARKKRIEALRGKTPWQKRLGFSHPKVQAWLGATSKQMQALWQKAGFREAHSGDQHWNWQGGCEHWQDYGPNWQSQRHKARERDMYICQRCGITEAELGQELDVHHIKPRRLFDDYELMNELDNLICLCPSCHKFVEINGYDSNRM